MNLISNRLREEIKRRRLVMGLSQKRLGRRAGIPECTPGFIEVGRMLYVSESIIKIMKTLDIPHDETEYPEVVNYINNKKTVKTRMVKMKKPRLKRISEKLRQAVVTAREDKEISVANLAKEVGSSEAAIRNLENGTVQKITPGVAKVLSVLDINPDGYTSGKRSYTRKKSKGHNDFKAQVLQVIENYGDAMYEQGKEDALAKLKETLGV